MSLQNLFLKNFTSFATFYTSRASHERKWIDNILTPSIVIHLKDINKTYYNGAPLHVLKGIDIDIKKGEFVSIMGASVSGKSTLLNILGILDSYDTGEYYLNNVLIKNLS